MRLKTIATLSRFAQVVNVVVPRRPAYGIVSLVPDIANEGEAARILERLQWYLGNVSTSVRVTIADRAAVFDVSREAVAPSETGVPKAHRSLQLVHAAARSEMGVFGAHRTRIIDEAAYGKTAIVAAARICYADLMPIRERRALSGVAVGRQQALRRWLTRFKGCQLFGTGPSLERISTTWLRREDEREKPVLRIACNSIVSDRGLMDLIHPHILTFGDPAFHFGNSEYADTFRSDIRDAMKRYPDLYLVMPLEYYPLVEAELAEFGDRVVPCPVGVPGRHDPYLFERRGQLLRTGNIATSAMIPLGVCAGAVVEFFGFDGRAPEDKRFWAHSEKAQYGSLYSTVVDAHPSFFRDTSYTKYYETHCKRMATMFRRIERRGIKIVARTPSYVPCLAVRHHTGAGQAEENVCPPE